MARKDFRLSTELQGQAARLRAPAAVRLPLFCHQPVVSSGEAVAKGQLVAEAMDPGLAGVHASVAGTVAGIEPDAVEIVAEGDACVEPTDISNISGPELGETLHAMGAATTRLIPSRTLIINAMPPEPGTTFVEQLLRDHRDVLAAGLDAVRRVVRPVEVFLALIQGDTARFGNCTVKHLPPVHPAGLDPMVHKAVTGLERPRNTVIVSALALYHIGLVVETGLPLTETILTVGGQNVLAPIGASARDLLEHAGISALDGGRVVFGGPFRGQALHSLSQGLPADAGALLFFPSGSAAPVADAPCLDCGECVRRCPARIRPGELSRMAEFRLYERARDNHLHACIDCGICGYWCPSRRPILQYLRLARQELALMELAELERAEAAS